MTASKSLPCPMCDGPISEGHRAFRGRLINTINLLASTIATKHSTLTALRKKVSKPGEQAKDFAAIMNVQTQLVNDQKLYEDLTQLNEACNG